MLSPGLGDLRHVLALEEAETSPASFGRSQLCPCDAGRMLDVLRRILDAEPGVAYALLFGSCARGTGRPDSDADIAIELTPGALGGLAARLESAAGRAIDLVLFSRHVARLGWSAGSARS